MESWLSSEGNNRALIVIKDSDSLTISVGDDGEDENASFFSFSLFTDVITTSRMKSSESEDRRHILAAKAHATVQLRTESTDCTVPWLYLFILVCLFREAR